MVADVIAEATTSLTDAQTLSQLLTLGMVPAPDALRYAVQICDGLRRVHEDGRAHGAISPQVISLAGGTAQLLPGDAADSGAAVPYLAPERLQGHEPDACSDIFSFGALLYEMLTSRRAFDGLSRDVLPPPIGHPGFDRLVSTCLSREPSGRWQRMQQVAMELKLLASSQRRTETNPASRQDQVKDALRNDLRQAEVRWSALFEQQQHRLDSLSRAAAEEHARLGEALESSQTVIAQLASVDARLFAALERITHAEAVAQGATESIGGIQQTVKAQGEKTADLRAALLRTEDLVERVVEALEALQNMVIDQAGEDAVHESGV